MKKGEISSNPIYTNPIMKFLISGWGCSKSLCQKVGICFGPLLFLSCVNLAWPSWPSSLRSCLAASYWRLVDEAVGDPAHKTAPNMNFGKFCPSFCAFCPSLCAFCQEVLCVCICWRVISLSTFWPFESY